jgi:hypothetical protein
VFDIVELPLQVLPGSPHDSRLWHESTLLPHCAHPVIWLLSAFTLDATIGPAALCCALANAFASWLLLAVADPTWGVLVFDTNGASAAADAAVEVSFTGSCSSA